MSNSGLVDYTLISPYRTSPRRGTIKGVAIHCMAGNLTVESCGALFQRREASSHYGIGSDGRVGQYVDEKDRAWCTSNAIDHYLVTIEVANTKAAEPYPVSDAAYKTLIDLLVDICQRNGIQKLLWQADKSLMGQWGEQNMVVHRWTANKSCPGNWLYEHHGQIAAEVNARLAAEQEDDDMDKEKFKELWMEMRADLQDNDASAYSAEARQWAVDTGIIAGGQTSGQEFNGMWQDVMTREQLVTVLYRFAQKAGLV